MGFFVAAQGWLNLLTYLKSVKHILRLWNLAQLWFILERSKNYFSHVTHSLISDEISIFSTELASNTSFVLSEMQIKFAF